MTSTDTPTAAPPSLLDIITAQLQELPPLARAPEVRKRIGNVQDQIAAIEAQIQAAASIAANEQAKHDHAAAAALAAGKPIPPKPPEPKSDAAEMAELRRQVKALEPVLLVLQRIDRDGVDQEVEAFQNYMRAFREDLRVQSEKRHAQLVDGLLKLLDCYQLPWAYLDEAVCGLVHTVQQVQSPEDRAFRARLDELRAVHPGPTRAMRLEFQWRNPTATTMSTEFVRERIKAHMEKREGVKR